METITITCDQCKTKLNHPGKHRLELKNVRTPVKLNPKDMTAKHYPDPILLSDHHFCSRECLNAWLNNSEHQKDTT
jgi:hypothetical protein